MADDNVLPVRNKKNAPLFILLALVLGAAAGAAIWAFFKLMNICLDFLWTAVPARLDFAAYPIVVCAIGGLLIGLWQKKWQGYPEELNEVMAKVKSDHRYEYKNAWAIAIAALLPLIFGGSIGPEAGLTGVIAGLCTWVGDRFKSVAKEMQELAQIGIAATLSVIFAAPLFGFVAPFESENEQMVFPKKAKMVLYFAAIFGGMGIFALLTDWFGGGMGLDRFEAATIGTKELLWLLPLALIGTAGGYLYYLAERVVIRAVRPLDRFVVLRAVIGGLLLGTSGFILPWTMFAGEAQMELVMEQWTVLPVAVLLATGAVKIVISNVCLHTGWKGGNIFPVIFAGICIGYGMAALLQIDGVFAVAVVCASLCGAVMRKPLAVVLVLLLCFPLKGVLVMCAAAFIGATIPIPSRLRQGDNNTI